MLLWTGSRYKTALISPSGYEATNLQKRHPRSKKHVQMLLWTESRYKTALISPSGYAAINLLKRHPGSKKTCSDVTMVV